MIKFAIIRENDDNPEDITVLHTWKFDEKLVVEAPWLTRKLLQGRVDHLIEEARAFSVRV